MTTISTFLKKSSRFLAVVAIVCIGATGAKADYWTMTASQTNFAPGSTTPVTFTLTQTSATTSSPIGSFTIAFPAAFTVASPVLNSSSGKNWSIGLSGSVVCLQAQDPAAPNRLAQGETVVFSVSLTAPVAPGDYGPFTTSRAQNSQNCNLGSGRAATSSPILHVGDPVVCAPLTNRIYVNAAAAPGGTGSSWTCALTDLAGAITIANGNAAIKSIWVAQGIYKPSAPAGRAATFKITRSDLRIRGGFIGTETSASEADPVANPTIISGDLGIDGDPSDNSIHVITIGNLPASAEALRIVGFTVQGGNANITGSGNNAGGALFANYNDASVPVIFRKVVFTGNNASGYGGAVWISHCDVIFRRCSFVANTSDLGGAAYGFFSSSKFTATLFSQNSAVTHGGGYYGNYGTPVFNHSIFASNTARNGGAVYQNAADAVYKNSLLSGNSASFQGGAVYQHNGSSSTIVNSTFFSNSATNSAGALMLGSNASKTVASNTIFWKNKKGVAVNIANADIQSFGGGVNEFHNCVLQASTTVPADNGTTISDNTRGIDPLFTNESSPIGVDAEWSTADDGLQLQDGSPAVNTGSNAAAAGIALDLLASARIVCTTVDRGAYENQSCGSISAVRGKAPVNNLVKTDAQAVKEATGVVANPFANDLQIRYAGTEKCAVTVYDFSGKRMYGSGSIAQGTTHVDAGSWSRGFYQVVLNTASGKQMTFKVVKM